MTWRSRWGGEPPRPAKAGPHRRLTIGGHRKEGKFWAATLTALGQRLGVQDPVVETRSTCVDSRRQWRHARNVWHNSMLRSVLQTMAAPFRRHQGGG